MNLLNNRGSVIKYNFPSMCTIFHICEHIRGASVCSQMCMNICIHMSVSMHACMHFGGLVWGLLEPVDRHTNSTLYFISLY